MKNIITTHDTAVDLWNIVGQIVQSKQYQRAKTAAQNQPHPSPEKLHEYLFDELDAEEARSIRTHLAYCPDCTDDMITIMRIEDEGDEPCEIQIFSDLCQQIALDYYRFGREELAQTATQKSTTQEKTIATESGDIEIRYNWGKAVADDPAYIWIEWDAKIPSNKTFQICIINPDNDTIRYPIAPGKITKGEQTFSSQKLGFDPSKDPWEIIIVIMESQR